MTNPKLKELASLLDGACTSPEVERAAMMIVGEMDALYQTTLVILNEYRKRAWAAEEQLQKFAADTE